MQFTKGAKVILKSFNGKLTAKKGVEPCNNYWKLIGEKGKIIDDERFNDRVLVLFERDLDQFKVANHNPVINSLWILPGDLDFDKI